MTEESAYRVYRLGSTGRISTGDWIEAEDEKDARRQAQALCADGTTRVELWQGRRFVATLECQPDKRAQA